MGNGIIDSLKEAKGLLKLFAAIFCLLGAVGVSSLTGEYIYVQYSQIVLYSIGLAGGCLVALALLVSYVEDADNHITELICSIMYAVLNIIIGSLSAMNLRNHGIERNATATIVPVSALIAGILFILDFVREVKK